MPRLFMFIMLVLFGSMVGAGVIVVLVMGYYDWRSIVIGAAIGGALSFPLSWYVARRIQANDPKDSVE